MSRGAEVALRPLTASPS